MTDLDELFRRISNWGRWGPDDQRGALNFITPAKRLAAAQLVREGAAVSAALPLPTTPGRGNPTPVMHTMIRGGDVFGPDSAVGHSMDHFAIAPHGMSTSHIDALCHIFHRGLMYNNRPASLVASTGAMANAVDVAGDGIVSRGVLLDLPRLRGESWLEPGAPIMVADLEAAEAAQGLRVESGDILLIYTGRERRREARGGWRPRDGLAGLHEDTLPWLHAREVAVLGCDGVSDGIPSTLPQFDMVIHVGTIVYMGVHLLDNLGLEELARACAERQRWAFLFTVAPLKLLRGTGSPVNPIALF